MDCRVEPGNDIGNRRDIPMEVRNCSDEKRVLDGRVKPSNVGALALLRLRMPPHHRLRRGIDRSEIRLDVEKGRVVEAIETDDG